MNYKMLFACAVLACAPLLSATAETMDERIDRLERMIEGLQDQLVKVREDMSRTSKEVKEAGDSGKGVVRTDGKENVTVSTTGGGIKIKSDNGNSFELGGRILFDYDFFDDVFTADGDSESEGEFRRTRLTASGSVKKDWKYKMTVNIDDQNEDADINTAYIEYAGFKPVSLRVGKFKEPFSLERLTSSKWISTIERNMTLDFLDGNLGSGQPDLGGVQVAGYHKKMNHFNWALGVFDDGSEDGDGKDNYAVTGRVAMSPHFADGSFLHLGAAYSMREVEGRVGYRSRLGVHTADGGRPTFADAWVDDVDQFGLEAAYVRGPFSLQAEYIDVSADGGKTDDVITIDEDKEVDNQVKYACYNDLDNNGSVSENDTPASCRDIDFDGYYIQAAYTLTGEQRGYKKKGAVFDKIKPAGAMGAWELVARYEDVEVEDGNHGHIAGTSVDKGAEKWILGVNWYANKNVKFMLNYVDSEVDRELARSEGLADDNGNAWSLRAQYVF